MELDQCDQKIEKNSPNFWKSSQNSFRDEKYMYIYTKAEFGSNLQQAAF
jgi:hypothetical protein